MFPREATINGRTFHYNVYGQITRAGQQAPPLIAIGGWGMVQEEWGKLPFELSATRDVLTFDNQGIGGSVDEAAEPFTLASWCEDIIALAEEAFPESVGADEGQFAVLGFSMGAFAAQFLAASHPERVTAMVLIGGQGARDSAIAGDSAFFKLAATTMASEKNTLEANEARLRYFYDAESIAAEKPTDWAAVVKQNLRFKRPAATMKRQLKVLGSADVALDGITCPVLVMSGERDAIVPAANTALLLQQLVGAARKESVVVAGRAHMCWGTCPPKRQLSFQARDTAVATHLVAKHIQNFLAGGSAKL